MSAALSITCPKCATRLRVPANLTGNAVRCPTPTCRLAMRVGKPAAPPPPPPPLPQRRLAPPPPPAAPSLWRSLPPLAVAVLLVGAALAAGTTWLKAPEKPAAAKEPEKKPDVVVIPDGGGSMNVSADVPPAPGKPAQLTYEKDIRPLVEKYCLRCHSTAKKRGGVILESEKDDAAVIKNRALWEKVAENLREGVMPPDGAKKPTPAEMELLNRWLDTTVYKLDCTGKRDPGRVTIRRLNRAEYNNTIRELTGVAFEPARDFPADDVGYGFDNIGDVLSLPPVLMEKYLAAAEQVVEKAFDRPDLRRRMLGRNYREKGQLPKALRQFAGRAWRRPATDDEVKRLMYFTRVARDAGDNPAVGIKLALQAVLVSPHFLFRVEQDRPGVAQITDWELASRLSYFLWSSMPDEELFDTARKGELHKPAVLEAQVKRMLESPRARALADNFAVQWLNLRTLASFSPDPKRFPGVNAALKRDMMAETTSLFMHVLMKDRPVLDFLDADYTFVNEPLARHYGLKGVKGNEFRKVSLAGTSRGGVLTHASVLSVTSNPTRTSPVKRGKWVLENILGTPPPPPPPDVPELKAEGEVKGSLREQMEQHRKDPNCATCHARMDPLGFGYENFDAVGRWRALDGKHKIDPSGVLPDGSKFSGPGELRKVLLSRKDQFVRCLADKMLTYALGRGTTRADRCYIEEITKATAKADYRFRELVLQIVKSEPFQKRRGKGGKK